MWPARSAHVPQKSAWSRGDCSPMVKKIRLPHQSLNRMPRSLSTAPSQNTGMAKNRKAKKVETLSNAPYWRTALATPTATPRITETTVAATTRRRVTGMASPNRVVTARPLSVEVPMSPMSRSPSQLP